MSVHALEVKDLSKSFGGLRAIDRISFEIPVGGLSALIGPNGSGKTTLFNLITNLYRADAGRVRLFGDEMSESGDWRIAASGVVRTFQTARVFPGMTALENVLSGAHRHVRAAPWQQLLWLGRAREEERALLLRAIRGSGVTLLVVEHNMSLVMGVADEVIVLDAGAVVARGTPAEIQRNPRVIEAYIVQAEGAR